jgi:two-component system cell cycle sensor histidine kinase/response regulator CckA
MRPPANRTVTPPAAPPTVLVVDDDAAVRRVMVRALRIGGFDVTDVESGDEALRLLASEHDKFDLALIDLVMPGLDGRALTQQITKSNPRTRILLTSGEANDPAVAVPGVEGLVAFLPKPFSQRALVDRAYAVLGVPRPST